MWQIPSCLLCKVISPFTFKFMGISCGIRQFKWILGPFHQSELRKVLLIVLLSNCWYIPAQTYPKESSRLRSLRHWRFHNNCGWWCNQKFHKGYKGFPSDGAIRGLWASSSWVIIAVSCFATDWSVDCMSIVISESTRTACRKETQR